MDMFLTSYKAHYGTPAWMSQSEVFHPAQPMLLRGSLSGGIRPNTDVFKKSRPSTQSSGSRFGNLSHNAFFARHNPHPGRVRHMKGLLDIPICAVNDSGFFANPRYSMNFPPSNHDEQQLKSYSAYIDKIPVNAINVNSQLHPINTITGLQYFMGKPLNMRVFREKAVPRVGMVPVTDTWRDELKALTDAVGANSTNLPKVEEQRPRKLATADGRPRTTQYSSETGRLIPPPSRAMSRQGSRQGRTANFMNQLEHIAGDTDMESVVLQMLCQILQTDDVNAVKAWLVSAGDREKTMVLDMIRAALVSEEEYGNKDYPDQGRSRSALPDINENIEGQIIGAQNGDITKRIDRLSLIDGETPRPASQLDEGYKRNMYTPIYPDTYTRNGVSFHKDAIKEEDDEFKPPVSNDVFRTKSRSSDRPKSRGWTPKPLTPAKVNCEPKLRYTMTPNKDMSPRKSPVDNVEEKQE